MVADEIRNKFAGVKPASTTAKMELSNIDEFEEPGDELRKKIKNGIGLIAIILDGKIILFVL